jgi:hypothetical protein
MNKEQVTAILGSYLRAAFASVLTMYIAGVTDPKALASAFVASIAGPLLKWADPKAKEYGRGSK